MTVYRIRTWKEFKNLVLKFKPKEIFYAIVENPLGKPKIALRLHFICGKDSYIFIDVPEGCKLKKTRISLQDCNKETAWVNIGEMVRFMKRELYNDIKLVDYSMTTVL